MELRRIKAADYDEWLALLNTVFGRHNKHEMHFERSLPKMCVPDDEHMGMHFGVWEDGGLRAVVGAYPLPARIAGIPVLFSTVGNVATQWEYEGRGYMKALMSAAMDELDRMGADASRLGGMRQRYNRFGYESCGTCVTLTLTEHNMNRGRPDFASDLQFVQLTRDNTEGIMQAAAFNALQQIHVLRENVHDAWCSMTAWNNAPWLALRPDGTVVGFLSGSEDGMNIAEQAAADDDTLVEMLCAWQRRLKNSVTFRLAPWQHGPLSVFSGLCQSMNISSPSNFYIRSWDKITDALMKLKISYAPMPEGERVVEIADWGRLLLYVKGSQAGCCRTEREPDVRLDRLAASRFLFGPLPALYSAPADPVLAAWLPLPLSWNLQDRV